MIFVSTLSLSLVFGYWIKNVLNLHVHCKMYGVMLLIFTFYRYVVQEIEEVDTDEHYRPKSPIGIISVTLKQRI